MDRDDVPDSGGAAGPRVAAATPRGDDPARGDVPTSTPAPAERTAAAGESGAAPAAGTPPVGDAATPRGDDPARDDAPSTPVDERGAVPGRGGAAGPRVAAATPRADDPARDALPPSTPATAEGTAEGTAATAEGTAATAERSAATGESGAAPEAAATPVVDAGAPTETATPPVDHGAPTEAGTALEAPWRFWPKVGWQKTAVVVSAIGFLSYLFTTAAIRFAPMFDPWSCDGDQPQAVWHYWRYHIHGAFPPGDLITDYAFVMHAPPVWWALMASLSTFFTPLVAAKILNVVAYFGAFALLYGAVSVRSNHFVGLAAAFLMARGMDFYAQICGGYARSFGPLLVLLFLFMFLRRKHLAALAVLVFQAAFYPSVVIPCGIAYGIYVCLAGPTMRDRLRRMAGMFVAGLLVIACGEYQDLEAPKWWGGVVTLQEALKMPAWGRGGRIQEAPLHPFLGEFLKNAARPVNRSGAVLFPHLGAAFFHHGGFVFVGVVLAAVIAALWWRRRRAGRALEDMFPFELPLLFVASLCAYFLARILAYKLYLPYRALQHTWPYLFYAALPLALWCIFRNTLRRRITAGITTLVVACAPIFVLCGEGVQRNGNYWTNARMKNYFEFIRTLPIDKQLAGQIFYIDREPLFAYHRAYVTKNLAHPFRAGYYKEAERRIRVVYNGLYTADLRQFVDTMKREKIDYFLYSKTAFHEVDRRLFQPVKRDMARVFNTNRQKGFALEHLPASVYAWNRGEDLILDVHKLEEALDRGEVQPTVSPPSPAFIGPLPEPAPPAKPAQPTGLRNLPRVPMPLRALHPGPR